MGAAPASAKDNLSCLDVRAFTNEGMPALEHLEEPYLEQLKQLWLQHVETEVP